jgi:hypothetical protein
MGPLAQPGPVRAQHRPCRDARGAQKSPGGPPPCPSALRAVLRSPLALPGQPSSNRTRHTTCRAAAEPGGGDGGAGKRPSGGGGGGGGGELLNTRTGLPACFCPAGLPEGLRGRQVFTRGLPLPACPCESLLPEGPNRDNAGRGDEGGSQEPKRSGLLAGWDERVAYDPEFPIKVGAPAEPPPSIGAFLPEPQLISS